MFWVNGYSSVLKKLKINNVILFKKVINKKKRSKVVCELYVIFVIWKIFIYIKNINVKIIMRKRVIILMIIVLFFRLRFENLFFLCIKIFFFLEVDFILLWNIY